MDNCIVCGRSTPPGVKRCPRCAEQAMGPRAGTDATPDDSAVTQGLQSLAERGRPSRSERRIVTTVFADIVGSTSIAEGLDPEDVVDVINRALEAMVEPVNRFEGSTVRFMGDGVLCLFGAPVAHEDDALRACRASLAMLERVKNIQENLLNLSSLPPMAVRIGISTGLAVVGEVGHSGCAEYTAMGDCVNLASRLQGLAEPNSIYLCSETWRQVRDVFEAHDLGPLAVKGRQQKVRAYRLVRPKSEKPGDVAAVGNMVGRKAELACLCEHLKNLVDNPGGIFLISGEAGIGKSMLLSETRGRLSSHIRWIESPCRSYAEEHSYSSVRGLLHDLVGTDEYTAPSVIGDRFRHMLKQVGSVERLDQTVSESSIEVAAAIELRASLGHLLGVPLDAQETSVIESLGSDNLDGMIIESLIMLMKLVSRERPTALVLDNAHWIDLKSLAALRTVGSRGRELPLSVIMSFRPDSDRSELIRTRMSADDLRTMKIELTPLGGDDCIRLISRHTDLKSLSPTAIASLLSRAHGVPLVLEELLLAGADSKQGDKDGESAPMSSFQVATMSRVDHLPPRHKRVLQAASVIGVSFSLKVLEPIVQTDLSGDSLYEIMESLVDKGFIRGGGDNISAAAKRGEAQQYEFRSSHAMETIYSSLLKSDRRLLHRQVGEAIEKAFGDRLDEMACTLVHHFELGEAKDKTFSYLYRAGRTCLSLFDLKQARILFDRAIALAGTTNPADDKSVLTRVHEGLADVFYYSGTYQAALDHYDVALDLNRNVNRRGLLLRKEGLLLEKWGRYQEALKKLEDARECLEQVSDKKELSKTYAGLCLVSYHLGELEQAQELGRLSLQLSSDARDELGKAQAHNNLGLVMSGLGDRAAAGRYYEEALKEWEEMGHRYGQGCCHNNLGVLALEGKDWDTSLEHLAAGVSLFDTIGNRHGMARAYDNISQVYLDMGRRHQAEKYLERAGALMAEIGDHDGGTTAEMWQSGIW